MKYETKVTGIGGMVQELAEDGNLIILFNDDIKDTDLKDISVSHEIGKLKEDIVVGDVLTIGNKKFEVTSVGNVALKTLKDLGHCTIKFDGDTKTNLPGEIHVRGLVPEVNIGDIISFK
ncbi:PTS glucitol/sorbitol transporter subunit IIA [Intestinibacter bartlettii]|uniref:PTS glucitol/sorbitol transporter subunit IIA n=1 Tax=Intestinibacter bartlettii TaxID=261299 RepID=A0ABS6DVC0_9FIRM|nr:PTS glucitol/sorbitol transporter subunit IIA [Intestinibacter bartlettii]MBU5335756.1 PTS glucitol/sorbitol transporter subunit IIA [Intestinibacter bartlettii]MDO5009636.1 PTS glucitol/sorbitol transporter subunit IIA [Intestinibacter bartlettii]